MNIPIRDTIRTVSPHTRMGRIRDGIRLGIRGVSPYAYGIIPILFLLGSRLHAPKFPAVNAAIPKIDLETKSGIDAAIPKIDLETNKSGIDSKPDSSPPQNASKELYHLTPELQSPHDANSASVAQSKASYEDQLDTRKFRVNDKLQFVDEDDVSRRTGGTGATWERGTRSSCPEVEHDPLLSKTEVHFMDRLRRRHSKHHEPAAMPSIFTDDVVLPTNGRLTELSTNAKSKAQTLASGHQQQNQDSFPLAPGSTTVSTTGSTKPGNDLLVSSSSSSYEYNGQQYMLPMINHVWEKSEIEARIKDAKISEHRPVTWGDRFIHFMVGVFPIVSNLGGSLPAARAGVRYIALMHVFQVKTVMYRGFNKLTGFDYADPSPRACAYRLIILESIAGVPGMVAAVMRHFTSLR